jgi:hypothetical protein
MEAPLHLWAAKHNLQKPGHLSVYEQHLMRQGHEVEQLAKQFLQGFVAQRYDHATVTFEETITADPYQTRIDALVFDEDAQVYDLYEIKSGTSVHPEHKLDVTFQYLVGQDSGLPFRNAYLVHLNGAYQKDGEIDLQELFVVEDMHSVVEKYREEVLANRFLAQALVTQTEPDWSQNCHKPNECPAPDVCHPLLPEYPIYDLNRGTRKQYDALRERGVETVAQIPDDFRLNEKQRLQVQSAQESRPMIDEQGVRQELASLHFPMYFLDYETFAPAVPLLDGYHPYQNITFQYSLHVLKNPDDEELEHYEFLYTQQGDPSLSLSEQLLDNIGTEGTIIVWNKTFECGRNDELGTLQPQLAEAMAALNGRVYDLMDIFAHGLYVDHRFHGSASIKKVLPVLAPELSYHDLEIGEGATAMSKWYEMVYGDKNGRPLTAQQARKIAEDLLCYCELDTWAMVTIWKYLEKAVQAVPQL